MHRFQSKNGFSLAGAGGGREGGAALVAADGVGLGARGLPLAVAIGGAASAPRGDVADAVAGAPDSADADDGAGAAAGPSGNVALGAAFEPAEGDAAPPAAVGSRGTRVIANAKAAATSAAPAIATATDDVRRERTAADRAVPSSHWPFVRACTFAGGATGSRRTEAGGGANSVLASARSAFSAWRCPRSACAKAFASANRREASFDRHRLTMSSTCSGTSGRSHRSGRGSSAAIAAAVDATVSPRNGGRPPSSS